MNENEDSNFPYPKIVQNKLNHPLLLPILPRIVIRNKEPVESEPNINNNINYKNIYNNNIPLNNKDYKDDFRYQFHNKNKSDNIKKNKQTKNYDDNNENNFDDIKNINTMINNNNNNFNNTKKIITKRISNNVLINNIFPEENNNDFKLINNNMNNNIFKNYNNQINNKNVDNNKIRNDSFLNNNIQQINKVNIHSKSKISKEEKINNISNEDIVNTETNNINKTNLNDNYSNTRIKVNTNINVNLNQNNKNLNKSKEININNTNLGLNQTHINNIQQINSNKPSNQKINNLENNIPNTNNIKKISNISNNQTNNIINTVIKTNNISKEESTTNNKKKMNNITNNQTNIANTLIKNNNISKEESNNTLININNINTIPNNQQNIKNNINQLDNTTNNQSNNKITNIKRINNISNNQQNNILNSITKKNIQNNNINNIQNNILNNQINNTNIVKINNNQNPINNYSNNTTINQLNYNIHPINNLSNKTTINQINNNKQNSNNNIPLIKNKEKEQKNNLTNKNQTTFKFDTVILTSEYNSGNMCNSKRISEDTYNVYISSDCQDRELDHEIATYKVWFNFAVQSTITREMNINIVNLNNFLKVYRSGYQICIRELNYNEEPKDFENSYNLNEEIYWKRYGNFTASVDKENHLILKIKYKFESMKYVYFAFCFPFSYDKNNAFLNYLDNKINNNDISKIYFHNEVLIQSKEKRNVNLITITSKDNIIKNQIEQNLIGLFPNKNRCNKTLHDKPIIFISARVHPGETPGSHMMNGILKLLTDENNNKSELLRENFIFKIIPMINVDGVSVGNYRLDTNGYNLNRCYLNPEIKKDPEIFAIKKLFMLYNNIYKIRYYFDLHADMNVRGAYTYGNAIEKFESHVENVLYGFIFHLTSSHINWNHCIYSESSMKTKFKNDNNSKEATSRVHFYQKTGLIHTYTLESSYFKGDFDGINEKDDDKLYLINDFENTGRDCLISILHYEELTINLNIANSIYNDIYGCREYIANSIQMTEERFNLNFGLKNIAKDINKRKNWKSIKELNNKYLLGRANRNYSQKPNTTDLSLPKINKKLDSERISKLPLINNNNNDSNKGNDDKNEEKNNRQINYSKKGKRNLTPIIKKVNHNDNSDIVNYNEE